MDKYQNHSVRVLNEQTDLKITVPYHTVWCQLWKFYKHFYVLLRVHNYVQTYQGNKRYDSRVVHSLDKGRGINSYLCSYFWEEKRDWNKYGKII